MGNALQRWSEALAQWAIPQEILDRAPESPWGFPPSLFATSADEAAHQKGLMEPSQRRALEALPERGTVIDVGVGAGRSCLPLASRASRITGVDESQPMLARFAAAAAKLGVSYRTVRGTWPEVAPEAGIADVIVCHHVHYNVSDLEPFVRALTAAARVRVVVEVTAAHPQSSLNHLWRHFHGIERPTDPTYRDLLAALAEMDVKTSIQRWQRPAYSNAPRRQDVVAFARRRLCLPPERDPEVDELLGNDYVIRPRDVVTISWAGEA